MTAERILQPREGLHRTLDAYHEKLGNRLIGKDIETGRIYSAMFRLATTDLPGEIAAFEYTASLERVPTRFGIGRRATRLCIRDPEHYRVEFDVTGNYDFSKGIWTPSENPEPMEEFCVETGLDDIVRQAVVEGFLFEEDDEPDAWDELQEEIWLNSSESNIPSKRTLRLPHMLTGMSV